MMMGRIPVHHHHQQQDNEDDEHRSGPLVEVINGEIVIKESSLVLGGGSNLLRRRTTEEVDLEMEGNVIVEESTGITATYNSFTKRQKTQHWTTEETRLFYEGLRQCGTDFSTMETWFENSTSSNSNAAGGESLGTITIPTTTTTTTASYSKKRSRTRKQLKSKYLVECKRRPHLVDMAMNPVIQIPLGVYRCTVVIETLSMPCDVYMYIYILSCVSLLLQSYCCSCCFLHAHFWSW